MANKVTNLNVVAVNRIEKSAERKSVRDMHKMWKQGLVEFPAIQRNYVWGTLQCNDEGTETQSNWIHSLAINFPAPPILVNKVKREVPKASGNGTTTKTIWRVLDGQQRTTTAVDYIDQTEKCKNGGFRLHSETESVVVRDLETDEVVEHVVAEAFYDELPDAVKEMIGNFHFDVIIMEDLTEEQEELVFVRFNSGMALTKIENLRAEVGTKTTAFINELSATKFWREIAGLSDAQKNRFVDFELILQTAMIVSESELTKNGFSSVHIGFSDKAKNKPTGIDTWAEQYKATGLPDDLMTKLKAATAYLEQAFPEKETKYHKKSHIPMMVMLALKAIEDDIAPNKFAAIVDEFHVNAKESKQGYTGYGAYKSVSASKTADKTSVETRLDCLFNFYADVKETFNSQYRTPSQRKEDKAAAAKAKKEADKIKREQEKERQKQQDEMNKDGASDAEKRQHEAEEQAAKQAALLAADGTDNGSENKPQETQDETIPA